MTQVIKKTTFLFLLFFCLPFITFSQSLQEDAQRLTAAIERLEQHPLSPNDSLKQITALADVMAILQHYDQLLDKEHQINQQFKQLPNLYAKNPLLNSIIVDSLFNYPEALLMTAQSLAEVKLDSIAKEPRQKVLDLLGARKAVSPAEYLSIRNTLKRYVTPSIPLSQPMELAATRSNRNITESIVNTEAAVIKGLFSIIIEGAKKEVITSYLEQMLQGDAPPIREIFPTVVEQFEHVEIAYSNSFIERIRQAFFEDLQLLLSLIHI